MPFLRRIGIVASLVAASFITPVAVGSLAAAHAQEPGAAASLPSGSVQVDIPDDWRPLVFPKW